jgi:hypothetical protein
MRPPSRILSRSWRHEIGTRLIRYLLAAAFSTSAFMLVATPAPAAVGVAPPAAAVTFVDAAPITADGGVGLRLVEAPVAAGNDPRARVYIVDHLAPSAVISRRIEISNSTAASAHVVLYSGAASIVGGAFLGTAGRRADELSSWTSVNPAAYDIPPGARVRATVTIKIPRDATRGEQYAVVWAETRSARPTGGGLTQVSRVGIRLYVSVGPGGAPRSDFTVDSLTAGRSADGRPVVLAAVHNTGARALDMSGSLRLHDGPGGLIGGPFPVALGVTLGIGDTEPVKIVLDKRLPAGPWRAQVTLRSGLLERTVEATITFPQTGMSPPVKITPVQARRLKPAVAGLALLLLVAVCVPLVLRRPRRRADDEPTRKVVRPDRRRDVQTAPGGPAQEPVTEEAVPYHWQLALPQSHDPLTHLVS